MRVVKQSELFDFRNYYYRYDLYNMKEFTFAYFNLGEGQLSIGGIILNDGKHNWLYYAVAFCSPEDCFTKKVGREKIRSHMCMAVHNHKRGKLRIDERCVKCKPFDLLEYAAKDFLTRKTQYVPEWAKGKCLTCRNTYKQPYWKEENTEEINKEINKYYSSYLMV